MGAREGQDSGCNCVWQGQGAALSGVLTNSGWQHQDLCLSLLVTAVVLHELTSSVVLPINGKRSPAVCESGRLREDRSTDRIFHCQGFILPRVAIDRTLDTLDGRRTPGKGHGPEIRQRKDAAEKRGFNDPFRRGASGRS